MKQTRTTTIAWSICLIFTLLLSGCNGIPGLPTQTPTGTPAPTPPPVLQAEVVFQVDIPRNTPENPEIYIDLLDEITGLAINPRHYLLEEIADFQFATRISIPIGSLVKYRYGREGNPPAIEFTPNNKQVRYRLLKVSGPVIAKDVISAWTDFPYKEKFGRIGGKITDAASNAPLPNIMVAAGGAHTFTSSTGDFLIEGVPEGTHRIVAYCLDGAYDVFQQGATVAVNSVTPANIKLNKSPTVKVTFSVTAPQGSIRGIPMRLIGNTYALGNTFSDLSGGLSTVAARAPLMTMQNDGSYTLTLDLPVGLDLRYKYSLGDGFWNSEISKNGAFRVRQLIVPGKEMVIRDSIDTWTTPNYAPIQFTVKVPSNTPGTDTISIQFNPYGWTEPVPMWPLGNNQWMYVLYNPLSIVGSVGYRYCRNDQCGVADDEATKGLANQGLIFTPSRLEQNLQDEVEKWAWLQPSTSPTTVVSPEIQGRGSVFTAGIEFSPTYQTTWQAKWNLAFQSVKDINANWLFFTPTWTFTRQNPPVLEAQPGKDPMWQDLVQMAGWAQQKDFKLAVFPNSVQSGSNWWAGATRDAGWWQSWFDRYEAFLVNFADLATQGKAGMLILGEPSITPAVSGLLEDGKPSGAPADLAEKWKKIIANVRSHFKGTIYWATAFPQGTKALPIFIDSLDGLYVLWSAPINVSASAKEAEMVTEIGRLFDQELIKIKEAVKKPMIIGINPGSFDGAVKGCATVGSSCLPVDSLNQPAADISTLNVDLAEQASIYNAFLTVLNTRKWIDGFVSRGYYPPAAVQDKSSSIHGKPASDMIWYWYPKLLANPK